MKVKLYLRSLLFTLLAAAISTAGFAQGQNVSGTVTGADDNLGIPGASVVIKGTTRGVTTDIDGKFTIETRSSSDVLVFSFVGYSAQEIAVGNQSVINVSLSSDISSLDEVIVTGYSITNKKESSAAVSIVQAKDLKQVPSGNVEQQLQGRVTGLTVVTNGQPGTASQIRVRGFGAFGGNEPLYVVDGVPVGNIDFLAPDDIETTTVLKDAAAASIYGARAANGVIVYTTKRGGKGKRRVQVTYDGFYGATDPNVNGVPQMLTPQEQAEYTKIAQLNNIAAAGIQPGTEAYTNSLKHPQFGGGETATIPDYLHANGQNGVYGSVDVAAIQAAYDADPENVFLIKPNLAGTNWYDAITRVGQMQRHGLGLSGGTENGRYYFGANLQNQQGILIGNDFKRYSFRANSEFDLTKKVRIGENLQFTYRSVQGQQGGQGGLGIADDESEVLQAYRMPSIIPVRDEFGSYASTKAAGFNNPRNPVRRLNDRLNNRGFNTQAFGNFYIEVDPIENLTLRSSIGGTYNNNFYRNYGYRYLGDSEPQASNSFNEGGGYSLAWTFTNTATYKTSFGKNNVRALVGYEALNTGAGRFFGGSGINPFSMDLDYVNLSTVGNPVVNSGLYNGVTFASQFGKVDYNFNEKYYVTGVLRRDGSSRFGSNSRYGVFPAFSAAWRVSSEEFMKEIPFITDLKIRGGWGEMGNSNNVDPNNQYSLFGANRGRSFYPISGQNNGVDEGYYRTRIGNPDARWETSVTTNIGIDGVFANGKLEVVLDVWRKDTKDLLFGVPIPTVVGSQASAPLVNIAEMRNEGIDFQIINKGKLGSEVNYELTFNNSFLKNEIVSLIPGLDFITSVNPGYRGINPIRNSVGRPISSFFGYNMIGYFSSQEDVNNSPAQDGAGVGRFKYEDINGDGVITPDDRTWLGSPVPNWTGGLNGSLTYKNFDLNIYTFASIGGEIWNQSKWFTDFYGSFEGSGKGERAKQSWTPALGDNALAPIWESASNLSTNAGGNSWYVEDGSYFRLQNISLGYNLPSSIISKLGMTSARIAISGNNFITLTKYQGLDPSVGGNADTQFGIDVGNYPITRSYNAVLNLAF